MFNNPCSYVLFHGTKYDIAAFDATSHLRGNAGDPNNRLGVWLTDHVGLAMDYAEAAGAAIDFPGILVVEVDIPDSQIAHYRCELNTFVMGDFKAGAGTSPIDTAFARARKRHGKGFNRGAAFLDARDELLAAGFKAVRAEICPEGMMAILDPERVSIRARLVESEGITLYRMLRARKLGPSLRAKDAAVVLQRIIENRNKKMSLT